MSSSNYYTDSNIQIKPSFLNYSSVANQKEFEYPPISEPKYEDVEPTNSTKLTLEHFKMKKGRKTDENDNDDEDLDNNNDNNNEDSDNTNSCKKNEPCYRNKWFWCMIVMIFVILGLLLYYSSCQPKVEPKTFGSKGIMQDINPDDLLKDLGSL